jgi:hypothetical protein
MPYLVVTVSPDGVRATAVASKHEARVIASKKTLNVEVEDATGDSSSQVEAKPLKTSARASSGVRRLLCSVILPRSASHGVGVKL